MMKNRILLLAILMGLILSATVFIVSPVAHAATEVTPVKAILSTDQYTINWFDAFGHLVKTWKGSKEEADKIKRRESAKHPHLLVTKQSAVNTVHPNINRVYGCSLPNDFFDLYNQGLLCFANSGGTSVLVYSVYEIDSGHNHGDFGFNTCCASVPSRSIGYQTTDYFNPTIMVTRIHII